MTVEGGHSRTERIGFKRHLRPEVVKGEAVYLFSDSGVTAIRGQHIELLASLLDGTRDVDSLLRDVPAHVPSEQIRKMLGKLHTAGLIGWHSDESATAEEAALAYWDATGLDPVAASSSTATARVSVISAGGCLAEPMAGALREAGVEVVAEGAGDLTVVVCADYLAPELAAIDEAHRAANRPWLIVKPVGTQVWVGPFFTPGEGACWHCLAARLSANRPAEAHVRAASGQRGPAARPAVFLPSVSGTAAQVAALETTKWLAGYRHDGQREVWAYDSLTTRVSHHTVTARPQCRACGDPESVREQANRPVRLRSRTKVAGAGGGHRSSAPRDVLARYRHLISPVTGIVKEVRRDPRGPEFLNSYLAGGNLAATGRGLDGLWSTLRCESGGKGVTPLDAEVGALCEALERHSASFHGDEAVVRASFAELGEQAIHPDTCQLFHPSQFADRARWNGTHSAFQYVTEPFDEHAELDWTPVWSLTGERHRLLPTGMLYFGAPAHPGVIADSNGCAAGSSLEDAVLQGMLELIERDAVALWWYNRTPMPAVDLDAFADPWITEVREVHRGLGREVWVLDLTADLDIPVMAAVSRRIDGPREDIMFGFGAHLDPHIALRRCLTELNQVLPAVVDLTPAAWRDLDTDLRQWLSTATVANQPYLVPSDTAPAVRHRYSWQPDLHADVRMIQARLEALGLEVLVLDQTRPDIGLPVVKVIVPGLRHFWSRLARGRLYDVPVSLGRLDKPSAYDELNPIPLFM
ncbi:TOMM precursor leader peptide-binding protein [Lentzea nigeriaca]